MEMIMMSINESWIWLGPLLVICFGTALIAQVIDLFTETENGERKTENYQYDSMSEMQL